MQGGYLASQQDPTFARLDGYVLKELFMIHYEN